MSDSPTPILQTLDYQGPRELPPPGQEPTFKAARVCWGIPLALGTVTFLLDLVIPCNAIEATGVAIFIVGALLALAGSISLLVFVVTRWPRSSRPLRDTVMPAIKMEVVLLSNFLVAMLYIAIALRLHDV